VLGSSHFPHHASLQDGRQSRGKYFVVGTLSLLAREADNLQQELSVLNEEINDIENRLKYVAEHWEYGKPLKPLW
jgi:hypothetical protein